MYGQIKRRPDLNAVQVVSGNGGVIRSIPYGDGYAISNEDGAVKEAEGCLEDIVRVIMTESEDGTTWLREALSLSDKQQLVGAAFSTQIRRPAQMRMRTEDNYTYEDMPNLVDIFDVDNYVIVRQGGRLLRVNYTMGADQEITFAPRDEWRVVEKEYPVSGSIRESSDKSTIQVIADWTSPNWMQLEEGTGEDDGILFVEGQLLQPGFGNMDDRRFYTKRFIESQAHKFTRTKMYATNHNSAEKTPRNWVGTIVESGKRFAEDGSAIVRIAIHKDWFAEDVRRLSKLGLLDLMKMSIMAGGVGKRATIGGIDATIAKSIEEVSSVDFVHKDGAGGMLLRLSEEKAETDLRYANMQTLAKIRPDLIEQIKGGNDSQELGEAAVESGSDVTFTMGENNSPSGENTSPNSNDKGDNEMELKEMEAALKEAQLKLEEANKSVEEKEALIKEQAQKLRRTKAVEVFKAHKMYKKFPEATQKKLTTLFSEAEYEDEDAIAKVVGERMKEEAEYLHSVGLWEKKPVISRETGDTFGDDWAELEENKEELSLEEAAKAVDAVMANYHPQFAATLEK